MFKSTRRRDQSEADAAAVTRYAFCEPVTAVAMGKEHIRVVGPEGRRLGGGIPHGDAGGVLCGRDLGRGWDLGREVTPRIVEILTTPRDGDSHVWVCPKCAEAYRQQQA